ncbi:hypothetical protein LZ30DRAFT_465169 [Colletotrichum cereale]|nr:hypothetical protein LZ30DRAFT_465169 [Colletotrichum cereale]
MEPRDQESPPPCDGLWPSRSKRAILCPPPHIALPQWPPTHQLPNPLLRGFDEPQRRQDRWHPQIPDDVRDAPDQPTVVALPAAATSTQGHPARNAMCKDVMIASPCSTLLPLFCFFQHYVRSTR